MNRFLRYLVLFGGALLFVFPFYYMLVSSFQEEPDTSLKGAFPTGGFTLDNYIAIDERVDLIQSLVNSGDLHRRCPAGDGRLRGAGRVCAGAAALPRARAPSSPSCCWCRPSPSSS